ncbi:unnamed protein product [Closterium sp. NIES-65]|nr:unnamed protein product [Closterium sp. NIES-65]
MSVNRTFNAGLRWCYNDFATEGIDPLTPTGEHWPSWKAIPEELLVKAFETTGTDDHLVLAHMRDAVQVEFHDGVHTAVEVEEWVNPLYVSMAEELDDTHADEASDDEDECNYDPYDLTTLPEDDKASRIFSMRRPM